MRTIAQLQALVDEHLTAAVTALASYESAAVPSDHDRELAAVHAAIANAAANRLQSP